VTSAKRSIKSVRASSAAWLEALPFLVVHKLGGQFSGQIEGDVDRRLFDDFGLSYG
jgi:hypothetical protein